MDDLQTINAKWEQMLEGKRPCFYVTSNEDFCQLKQLLASKGLTRWVRPDEKADVCCDFEMDVKLDWPSPLRLIRALLARLGLR